MRRTPRTHRFGATAAGIALLLVLSNSCTAIRWISDYDETTDKSLTAIQGKTDDLIVTLEASHGTPGASLENCQPAYDDIDRELRRLEFRVAAIPRNATTEKLVADIRKVILGTGQCSADGGSLRDLHCLSENKEGGPSRAALEISRRNINAAISAALAVELAKKQGTGAPK